MKSTATILLCTLALAGCSVHKINRVKPCPATLPATAPVAQVEPAAGPYYVAPVVTPPEEKKLDVEVAPVPHVDPPVNYKDLFEANVQDVFFDFNSSDLHDGELLTLDADIEFFKAHPGIHFDIVSSCDKVGTDPYNDLLGQRRAYTVRDALRARGITQFNAATLGKTTSYGSNDAANRRVHFEFVNVE